MDQKTVLFLCSGNYYRSRFAEHFFNWHSANRGLCWKAQSKGLAVGSFRNIGPISRFALDRLNEIGIHINGNSRFPQQVSEMDLSDADLIVAMKEAEHRALLEKSFSDRVDQVEFWQINDLDCAEPNDALPVLENKVLRLLDRLDNDGGL